MVDTAPAHDSPRAESPHAPSWRADTNATCRTNDLFPPPEFSQKAENGPISAFQPL